ncbi:hypothetical protein HYU17_02330 [Candidatus Woesearchaeota archaeon]|nr:hypothetical protein [Candidatus Woesearchaeota archaeon]
MPQKRGSKTAVTLYFALLALLLGVFAVYAFNLYPLQTDFFSRYLIGLLFVLMLLPLIPKIKIFDVVDIKREARMFRAARSQTAKKGKP